MSLKGPLLSDLIVLVNHYAAGNTHQLLPAVATTAMNSQNDQAFPTHGSNFGNAYTHVTSQPFQITTHDEPLSSHNMYPADCNMGLGVEDWHNPDLNRPSFYNSFAPSQRPMMIPRSLEDLTSDLGVNNGISSSFPHEANIQPTGASASPQSAATDHPNPGTIYHHELYPNWENVTSPMSNLKIESIVDINISYRRTRTIAPEQLWETSDGMTIVNIDGVPMKNSPYLPDTVSTKIKDWQVVLIMKLDGSITIQDFIDRMPKDSKNSKRCQKSTYERNCSKAKRYHFHDIDDAANAG